MVYIVILCVKDVISLVNLVCKFNGRGFGFKFVVIKGFTGLFENINIINRNIMIEMPPIRGTKALLNTIDF